MTKCIKLLLNHIPTRLPQGVSEFTEWSNDILNTYGMPNNDSTHFALATAVMHAKNGQGYFSKHYFANVLIKGAANQIAHHIMLECKERQQKIADEQKAAEDAKLVEDTTPQKDVVASNVSESN